MEEKIKYRYFASGRSGTRQVFPINGQAFALAYNEIAERLDYLVTFSEKLKFIGQDFLWFYQLEKLIYRCDYIGLTIEKYCGSEWSAFFVGKVSLNSGDPWNLDKCVVDLSISESNAYDCIDEGGDKDLNLFNFVPERITAKTIIGDLEYANFNILSADGSPVNTFPGEADPYTKGWQQSYLKYSYHTDGDPGLPGSFRVIVTWVRETLLVDISVSLESPWVLIETTSQKKYARPAILYSPTAGVYDPEHPDDISTSYKIVNQQIDNGLPLRKCLEAFIQQICSELTLESDFFQWNPIVPTSINYVTGEPSKVLNLVVFQKSDVKRPDTTNNANILTSNFIDLLNDISNIYQLKYAVTSTGKLKIEHVDYYSDSEPGLDTTLEQYIMQTAGNRVYSYDKDSLPNKETFLFKESSFGDFKGNDIQYSGSCSGQGDNKEVSVNVEHITTDVQLCLANPDPDGAVSDDGIVLIACDSGNSILREASILGGNVLNNTLAWAQLHRDYWRYNRPQKTFTMNGVLTTAFTVKPTKLQAEFKIPLCCSPFDPKYFIKTSLGDMGKVKSAKYELYSDKLTLSILHPSDSDLQENNFPTTIGDTALTYKNISVTIDVLANDFDSDGDIIPSTLQIVVGPSMGNVEITFDFKVLYTPNIDFTGSDIFVYRVADNLGAVSTNTIVTITVNDGSAEVEANPDSYMISKSGILNIPSPGLLSNDTGPSELTAVSETKVTTLGGSVIIYANGSFKYTPPTSTTIGDITDSFTYTVKDINDNTDIGSVNISLFDPQEVYFSLIGSNFRSTALVEDCSGAVTLVGNHSLENFDIYFYSDPAKTIALDVTGYGLTAYLEYYYDDSQFGNYTYQKFLPCSGTTINADTDLETSYSYNGCSGLEDITRTVTPNLITLQYGI